MDGPTGNKLGIQKFNNMFNNAGLDVVIGLVFIYLLYSLLGTILVEIIATNFGLRGWLLQKAIERMLNDEADSIQTESNKKNKSGNGNITSTKVSNAFFAHPLIKYLKADSFLIKKRPSYIDAETFTKVLIDLLRGPEAKPGGIDRNLIQHSLEKRQIAWKVINNKLIGGKYMDDLKHEKHSFAQLEPETCMYLESVWTDAQGDLTKFKAYIIKWFNEMMERTTGWYKKYTQFMLLAIGLLIAVFFNVDTIKIAKILQAKPELRKQMIEQVGAFTKAYPNIGQQLSILQAQLNKEPAANKKQRDSLQQQIDNNLMNKLQDQQNKLISDYLLDATHILGIGYGGGFWQNVNSFSLIGWLLTALAISMGAPFWFDLLNKIMQLRSSLAPKVNPIGKTNTDTIPEVTKIVG